MVLRDNAIRKRHKQTKQKHKHNVNQVFILINIYEKARITEEKKQQILSNSDFGILIAQPL